MAVNPYFTFADPALQQAVVQEAQVQAAAEAARAQQRAATLAALRQERQQRADLEERRAIREGDIRRLDANEAERRRQFDENMRFNREALTSQEKVGGVKVKDADDRELYGGLLKLVEGDDPPTLKELEARMVGLSDERKQLLRDRRNSRAAAKKLQFTQSVNEANRLRGLIGTVKEGKTLTADDVLRGSQWKNVLQVTPDGLGFESLLTPPREDESLAPPTVAAPDRPSVIRSFIERKMAGAAPPGAESIQTIIGRNRGGMGGATVGPGPGMFVPDVRGMTPTLVSPIAPPRMLGNEGVLAPLDYSGPEFDYSRPRFAVPPPIDPELERLLAPPVFAPAY